MVLQEHCLQVYALSMDGLTVDVVLVTKTCHGELNKILQPDAGVRFYSTLSPVCRQIYDDTCLLPYTLNSFSFKSIDAMRIWTSSRLPIQSQQIKTLKAPYLAEHFYFDNHTCRLTDRLPNLEVLYLGLWNVRRIQEMNGWSADHVEQDLRDMTKILLGKEKGGLKIVVTEYTNLGPRGKNILQPV